MLKVEMLYVNEFIIQNSKFKNNITNNQQPTTNNQQPATNNKKI